MLIISLLPYLFCTKFDEDSSSSPLSGLPYGHMPVDSLCLALSSYLEYISFGLPGQN